MKKLLFTALAVLAFNGSGFAEGKVVTMIPNRCCGTFEGWYAIFINHGFTSGTAGDLANMMENACENIVSAKNKTIN